MLNGSQNSREADPEERAAADLYRRVIAIDGPAAAGKTTVAQAVAKRLKATLFDTGALYRTVTLAAIRRGISDRSDAQLADVARQIRVEVSPPSVDDGRLYDVRLDGQDVTWAIRSELVEARVSAVSAVPDVRSALLPVQRRIAASGLLVMVGRDIGSVVIPEAGLKVYLDASVDERARRRCRELQERGQEADLETILASMRARDAYDAGREIAPLKIADDAVVISTDGRTIESIVDEITAVADERGIAGSSKQVVPQ